jgi:signal transduction histidine kinase
VGSKTRPLLAWWLGGLLLLSVVTGVAALMVLARIRAGEAALRAGFVERSGWLEQLRSGIYLSGTLARDYLAAPTDPGATALLEKLRALETDTSSAVSRYSESRDAANLRGEVATYWKLLDLMVDVANGRHTPGTDAYFRRQLAQRRENMFWIASEIGKSLDGESRRREAELTRVYAEFRWVLLAALAVLFGLALAVSLVTGRRLMRLEAEARALSAQVVQAQEQERRAIARELHDEIGQALSGLLLDVGNAARAGDPSEVQVQLHAIAERAERTVDAVRRMALSLRPSMLDDLGLVAALEWQAREVGHRTGLDVQVQAEDSAGDLPDAYRTCIYRVAQEALQNCARHASAKHVRIGLERVANAVILRVEDDGKGFLANRTRGLGLLGMEERAAQLRGRVRVQSEPGHGTCVRAEIPL